MALKTTSQLLLRPSEELISRIEKAAEAYGYRSRNEVAVEVLETYFEFWELSQQAKQEVIDQQRAMMIEASGVYARGKGSRSEIERITRNARSRTKKR